MVSITILHVIILAGPVMGPVLVLPGQTHVRSSVCVHCIVLIDSQAVSANTSVQAIFVRALLPHENVILISAPPVVQISLTLPRLFVGMSPYREDWVTNY